ncbi:MAG TPA: glycosyltransferase family 2 protein [Geobacteraceae bacterium]|nr:glycosyltransferase family 2 protein [Geobacteraceae bacterium]
MKNKAVKSKISAIVRTRNEEKNLEECLESISWADEIVVVDSRSTDRTIEIAKKFTDRIFIRDWPGHIAQSQFATDQASSTWVLSMDADERVTPELRDEIIALDLANTPHDAFEMPRRHFFMKRWIKHSGWYPDRKIRLFRKDRCHWGGYNPHDVVKLPGSLGRLKNDLVHYIYCDISHFANTKNAYSTATAGDHFNSGRKAHFVDFTLRPIYAFVYRYFIRLGFLDGLAGFVICVEEAHGVFLKYIKLFEMEKKLVRISE